MHLEPALTKIRDLAASAVAEAEPDAVKATLTMIELLARGALRGLETTPEPDVAAAVMVAEVAVRETPRCAVTRIYSSRREVLYTCGHVGCWSYVDTPEHRRAHIVRTIRARAQRTTLPVTGTGIGGAA